MKGNYICDEGTKILIGEVESVELSEEFAHEKLSPVLAMYKSNDFADAIKKACKLIDDGGLGHTSSLYINKDKETKKVEEFYSTIYSCPYCGYSLSNLEPRLFSFNSPGR